MQEPIYLSDISLLGGLGEVVSITNGTIINFFASNYLLLIIQTLIFIAMFFCVYKVHEEKHRREYTALVEFIVFIILSLPFESTTNIMRKIFGEFHDYADFTNNVQTCLFYGITGSMYYNMLDNRIFMPEDYNEKEIEMVLNYSGNTGYNNDDINIVFVFSESFFDITKISDNVRFSDNLLKDYQNIKKKSKVVQLISPSYGGISSNVEWELFTGFNLAYYNRGYIPFLKLVDENTYQKENILAILANNSYKNYIFYASDDSLYNEGKVYERLKFIKNKPNEKAIRGFFTSDDYITEKTIDKLKSEQSNIFFFDQMIQSHMPYTKDKYSNYNVSIKESNLDLADQEVVLSYAEGINDASMALNKLNDYIQSIDKKTVIIFMGDHLPYLSNSKGENVIDKLDYFNTNDNLTNTFRKYNTEAVIISNFDIDFDDTKCLSPDLLMPYVLNALKIKMTPYYNYLINESKNILPSYNRYVAVNNEGELFYTNNLSGPMLKEYNLRKSLQYKLYFMK